MLVMFGIVFIATFILPSIMEPHYSIWPLSPDMSQKVRWHLYEKLNETRLQYAATAIADAIEYHNGKKALALNFVGYIDPITVNTTIRSLSKSLFGSEISDVVLYLGKHHEKVIKGQIFRHLNQWPFSIIVLDYKKSDPKDYLFLTSALDGNFPLLDSGTRTVRTNAAIFIFISDIMHQELAEIQENNLYTLDARVKEYMKDNGWPDRICQRIDHIIPFFAPS